MTDRPRMGLRANWQQKPTEDRGATLRVIAERVDVLKGRRSALQERHDTLERDVGLAKGRLGSKGAVEKFIQELQQDAYRRSTHSFETLLTAITQEVLPGAKPIGLDLTTERGLPSLSISAIGQGGVREDIFEDNGGALSDVIGMGLRLIAVVKSGGQRFLALDEPERWTMPARVPAFFSVLEDAARRLDVQCLAITHHDGSANFSSDVRISKLTGEPIGGSSITSDMPAPTWSDEQQGFRYIRLRNFQAFVDATMELGPGINAITGTNNHGKSCYMRALRAVFYGDTTDRHIRHGADSVNVEIGLAGGQYLKYTRIRKGSPKNVWSLHDANGAVVVENGELRQTGGSEPPAWVEAKYGIVRHDDHDIHISHQKYPVFLIDKPGSKRAAVLSFGQESGYTNDMLAIQKERVAKDNALVRDGEREIGTLRAQIADLEAVEGLANEVAVLIAMSNRIEERERSLTAMDAASRNLLTALTVQNRASAIAAALSDLPDPTVLRTLAHQNANLMAADRLQTRASAAADLAQRSRALLAVLADLPKVVPTIKDTSQGEAISRRLLTASAVAAAAAKRSRILDDLPAEVPKITSAAATTVRNRYALALQNSRKADAEVSESIQRVAAVKIEIKSAIDEHGGQCPTCGGQINPETLFHEHAA